MEGNNIRTTYIYGRFLGQFDIPALFFIGARQEISAGISKYPKRREDQSCCNIPFPLDFI